MIRAATVVVCLGLLIASGDASPVTNCTNSVLQCSGRGQCTDPFAWPNATSACLCDDGYITWPTDRVGPDCNYRQRIRITPFMLQLVFGWLTGCGSFMLHEIGWGVGQLLLFWLGLGAACVAGFVGGKQYDILLYAYTCIWSVTILAIQIAVLVLIGSGTFTDENDAPLGAWVN